MTVSMPDDVVQEHHDSIERFARYLLRSGEDAEDVVQDVWLEYLRRPPRQTNGLRAWLRTVTARVTGRNRARDRSRTQREEVAARPDRTTSFATDLERRSVERILRDEVGRLREPYRTVVSLRYLQGLEIQQIATKTGTSTGTVRSQLKRGLGQMRERMAPRNQRERFLGAGVLGWRRWRSRVLALGHPAVLALLVVGLGGLLAFTHDNTQPAGESDVHSAALSSIGESDSDGIDRASGQALFGRMSLPPSPIVAASETTSAKPTPRTTTVEGRVVKFNGQPASCPIHFTRFDRPHESQIIGEADRDGWFELPEVPVDGWIFAEGGRSAPSAMHWVASLPEDRPLILYKSYPSEAVRGVVRSADGRPVVGAKVYVLTRNATPFWGAQNTLSLAHPPMSFVETDEAGRFELMRPEPPRSRLIVLASGYAPFASCIADEAGFDTGRPIEIELSSPSGLYGNLRHADGSPASGETLRVAPPYPHAPLVGVTDAEGGYRFESLPPGPFRLLAGPGATAFPMLEAELEEEEFRRFDLSLSQPTDSVLSAALPLALDLVLEAAPGTGAPELELAAHFLGTVPIRPPLAEESELGSLELTLMGLPVDGLEFSEIRVHSEWQRIRLRYGESIEGVEQETGLVRFTDLPPGRYEYAFHARHHSSAFGVVEIEAGETTRVDLETTDGTFMDFVVRSERPIHPGEELQVLLEGDESLPLRALNRVVPDDLGGVLTFQIGLASRDCFLVVESSDGLEGSIWVPAEEIRPGGKVIPIDLR